MPPPPLPLPYLTLRIALRKIREAKRACTRARILLRACLATIAVAVPKRCLFSLRFPPLSTSGSISPEAAAASPLATSLLLPGLLRSRITSSSAEASDRRAAARTVGLESSSLYSRACKFFLRPRDFQDNSTGHARYAGESSLLNSY